MATRNSKQLASFVRYCKEHPEERFWQALRNWAGVSFIYTSDALKNYVNKVDWPQFIAQLHDTFYDE